MKPNATTVTEARIMMALIAAWSLVMAEESVRFFKTSSSRGFGFVFFCIKYHAAEQVVPQIGHLKKACTSLWGTWVAFNRKVAENRSCHV